MALLAVLTVFPSPSYANTSNLTLAQQRPHQDINISHSSFSWALANLPAIPYQVMLGFPGDWLDLSNHRLYLYYMILCMVFSYAISVGIASCIPPRDADNLLINEAIEKASLLCFIFSLIFFVVAFPTGVFLAAVAGYALGLFAGITFMTHYIVIVRGKIIIVRDLEP